MRATHVCRGALSSLRILITSSPSGSWSMSNSITWTQGKGWPCAHAHTLLLHTLHCTHNTRMHTHVHVYHQSETRQLHLKTAAFLQKAASRGTLTIDTSMLEPTTYCAPSRCSANRQLSYRGSPAGQANSL